MAEFWLDLSSEDSLDNEWQGYIGDHNLAGITIREPMDKDFDGVISLCDAFLPSYEERGAGIVCLSMPYRSSTSASIVKKARELSDRISRPNLMIGIIADKHGMDAIERLCAEGISVNALEVYSPLRAQQIAESIVKNSHRGARGIVSVSVSPYDTHLNSRLKQHGLAQNRIGFFVASKIYNLVEDMGSELVKVMFGRLDKPDLQTEDDYYIENLNLPNAYLSTSKPLYDLSRTKEYDESFHFQNRHIDAFFSFLTPAQISLNETEELLFKKITESL